MLECSGEEWMDVRQNQGVWEVVSQGKSEGAGFLAQHTMLQVCHHMAAVLEKGATILAG